MKLYRTSSRFATALAGVAVLSGATSLTIAETVPLKGSIDARIRTATYNSEDVFRLYGYVGYAIDLVFEDGESFIGKGGGDLDGISVEGHQNIVTIKPKAAVVSSNLFIYTDRRRYVFQYSVVDRVPNRFADETMYVLRFIYPPKPSQAGTVDPEAQVSGELARAQGAEGRNLDYWYCGARSLRPVATSDDGVHTRITFKSTSEIPAIFVRNEDSTESLLNFSMDAGDVVIHRLAPRLILRRGRTTGCIVNKRYVGSGERLKSGTLSPRIERERKDLQP